MNDGQWYIHSTIELYSEEFRQLIQYMDTGLRGFILPGQNLSQYHGPMGLQWVLFIIYQSHFAPLIIFSFLFALGYIGSRVQHRAYHVIAIFLVFAVPGAPFIFWFNPGSTTMLTLAVPFVMTVTVLILNFVKLSPLDYAIIFACFYYIFRFIGNSGLSRLALGVTIPAIFVMLTVLVIYKLRLRKLTGNLFYCWFICVFTFINGYSVRLIFIRYVLQIGQARDTRVEALLVWGVALLVVIAINTGIIYTIKRFLGRHFDNINNMGRAYPQIERFFIYNSVGIIVFMVFAHFFYGTITLTRHPLINLFDLFVLFAMVLQLSFIIMIYRITWLRDNLKNKSLENQSLAAYSSNLEKNIDDIKHIKHDIKNIFLAMGQFVEQSGNTEMQDFYHKKISPFASNEIAKSDLYGKLAGVDDEQIKAFLFYKISQAIERHISVDLDVLVYSGPSESAMEFIDLVRILGILLDNAIEECMEISDGVINIKVSRNDNITSYVIRNTVRLEVKEKGVRLGISTKGSGRGKGLASIRGIIKKYDFVTLSSYFNDDYFVQSLVIYNKPS